MHKSKLGMKLHRICLQRTLTINVQTYAHKSNLSMLLHEIYLHWILTIIICRFMHTKKSNVSISFKMYIQ